MAMDLALKAIPLRALRTRRQREFALYSLPLISMISMNTPLMAQDANISGDAMADPFAIIVTAQKREESLNTVPMSITAATGEQLANAGITQPRDLAKLTPAFHYADSYVGSPIYTLRGVGFSDISLGGRPTVSIYSDQFLIPFAIETRGVNLDLQRIEILKGPQGTLFGQNSTGGAINYIAATPTDEFAAGAKVSFGRFNSLETEAYLSGPISGTLKGRFAVSHARMDGWQRSYTTGETNGAIDFTNARVTLEWDPNENIEVNLTVNGWLDRSEVQAGQLIAITPSIPVLAPFIPGLLTYPLAPERARAADFNPEFDYARDNDFIQTNLRIDYHLNDDLTLTSLSSYSHYSENQLQDIDGTSLGNLDQRTIGDIESFSEELRLAGDIGGGHVTLGVTFAKDQVSEDGFLTDPEGTVGLAFTPQMVSLLDKSDQDIRTWATFAAVDYQITETISIYGGVRYTDMKNDFTGCSADAGDGNAAAAFGALFGTSIPVGGCVTLSQTFAPALVVQTLKEDNVSWRAGLDWTPSPGMMLYANVSKGYKTGGFPSLVATISSQLRPATQESVLAYETGFKFTLANHTLQLNGASFYYDYKDKQILGKVVDPIFGPNLALVNVPKSRIAGAEIQAIWSPQIEGLTLSAAASYIDSKIQGSFLNFDSTGALREFGGEPFPNTPKWHFVADVDYKFALSDRLDGFLGANASHESSTNAQLGELSLLAVDSYTLVDLRAGLASQDGKWRLTFWGRNVGDVYYWTTGNPTMDTTVRFAGMPATYGITLAFKAF